LGGESSLHGDIDSSADSVAEVATVDHSADLLNP